MTTWLFYSQNLIKFYQENTRESISRKYSIYFETPSIKVKWTLPSHSLFRWHFILRARHSSWYSCQEMPDFRKLSAKGTELARCATSVFTGYSFPEDTYFYSHIWWNWPSTRFLPKNSSQLVIFVIGLAFTWVWAE